MNLLLGLFSIAKDAAELMLPDDDRSFGERRTTPSGGTVMNEWISAAIALVAGIVVGTIASRIVLSVLNRSKVSAVRESAAPLAGLALSAGVIVGTVGRIRIRFARSTGAVG